MNNPIDLFNGSGKMLDSIGTEISYSDSVKVDSAGQKNLNGGAWLDYLFGPNVTRDIIDAVKAGNYTRANDLLKANKHFVPDKTPDKEGDTLAHALAEMADKSTIAKATLERMMSNPNYKDMFNMENNRGKTPLEIVKEAGLGFVTEAEKSVENFQTPFKRTVSGVQNYGAQLMGSKPIFKPDQESGKDSRIAEIVKAFGNLRSGTADTTRTDDSRFSSMSADDAQNFLTRFTEQAGQKGQPVGQPIGQQIGQYAQRMPADFSKQLQDQAKQIEMPEGLRELLKQTKPVQSVVRGIEQRTGEAGQLLASRMQGVVGRLQGLKGQLDQVPSVEDTSRSISQMFQQAQEQLKQSGATPEMIQQTIARVTEQAQEKLRSASVPKELGTVLNDLSGELQNLQNQLSQSVNPEQIQGMIKREVDMLSGSIEEVQAKLQKTTLSDNVRQSLDRLSGSVDQFKQKLQQNAQQLQQNAQQLQQNATDQMGNIGSEVAQDTDKFIADLAERMRAPQSVQTVQPVQPVQTVQPVQPVQPVQTVANPLVGGRLMGGRQRVSGKRQMKTYSEMDDMTGGLSDDEMRKIARVATSQKEKYHEETVEKILSHLPDKDQLVARAVKAVIYDEIKKNKQELSGLDRAAEMLKSITKKKVTDILKNQKELVDKITTYLKDKEAARGERSKENPKGKQEKQTLNRSLEFESSVDVTSDSDSDSVLSD